MLTFLCVLRSGGDYIPDYVARLRNGVARNMRSEHRFVCLSDVEVDCERIPLAHGWPGWWSKIEVFRPGVVTGPTLYLDLDTVIVDSLDEVASLAPVDFAMLDVLRKGLPEGNSGVMWLGKPQTHVYERFVERPEYWIDFHLRNASGRYMGDQAFISDSFPVIPRLHELLPDMFVSYKYDGCRERPKPGASVVAFGGHPRPHEVKRGWVARAWR
jgi:hypothetical protein